MVHHSAIFFLPVYSGFVPGRPSQDFVSRGLLSYTTSATFFFLLSGYVLACAYLRKGAVVDKCKFFAARFARIYPLYFAMLVLGVYQLLVDEVRQHGTGSGLFKTAKIFVANALMLQAWDASRLLRINPPSWSLCAEVFFYVCFPVLGAWIWKLRGAGLAMTAFTFYVGGQALACWVRPHVGIETLLSFPLLHFSTFALGILLARLQTLQREREWVAPAWQLNLVLVLSISGVLLSIFLLPLFRVEAPYNNGLLAPVFAGFIWSLSTKRIWLSRWLCAGWLIALGNASYALYLIHGPVLALFLKFNWVSRPLYVTYLALCVCLSLLSFYYFETPARLWVMEGFTCVREKRWLKPPLHSEAGAERSMARGAPVELHAGHDGAALQGDLGDLLVAGVA
jgi:peptidoglycan/LPS O-acetylase OafA/YrhL